MQITIDIGRLYDFFLEPPNKILWFAFKNGGWLVLIISVFIGAFYFWLKKRREKYLANIKQQLLAIDIPKDNEQSLVAVEQIFATLAGIKSGPNLYEKYWLGKTQLSYSLEIISLEGYIQFLIRTPEQFRDLVEAAIYAQYPEAEITEVDDYISLIPEGIHKPDSDYSFWGTEFTFTKDSAYPIRTYKSFEHSLTQLFIDPMASLLESMSKLGPGEQIGLQLVIAPAGDDWKEKGYGLIKKIIGEKVESAKNLGDKIIEQSLDLMGKFSEGVYKIWGDIEDEDVDSAHPNLYQYLTSGQKNVVEAMEAKLAKISFGSTFRIYYLAKKDRFQKGRGVSSIIGAINQFNSSDLNAFKKHKKFTTDADYFFVNQRVAYIQKKLIKLYKKRSREGTNEFYLNTEELATLYHFPTITVKAPLLKKTESRKAEAPTSLPLAEPRLKDFFNQAGQTSADIEDQIGGEISKEEKFTVKESLPGYDFDNDYFEEHFGKNPKVIKTPDKEPESEVKPPSNLPFIE